MHSCTCASRASHTNEMFLHQWVARICLQYRYARGRSGNTVNFLRNPVYPSDGTCRVSGEGVAPAIRPGHIQGIPCTSDHFIDIPCGHMVVSFRLKQSLLAIPISVERFDNIIPKPERLSSVDLVFHSLLAS